MAETMRRCEAHGSDWYRDWCVMIEMARREGHRVVDLDPCRLVEGVWSVPGELVDPATPDEVRAAVVPLLDLEDAAIRYFEGDEIRPKPPYWEDCPDGMKGWYRDESKAIVYAALGLEE